MDSSVDTEANGCNFRWNIENLNYRRFKGLEEIISPVFIANALGKTEWTLLLQQNDENSNFLSFYLRREEDCKGPDAIQVYYQIAFLGENGSVLNKNELECYFSKGDFYGNDNFVELKKVFFTQKQRFLREDTLRVQCILWNTGNKPDKSNHLFATTVFEVKRRCFLWRMDIPFDNRDEIKNEFKDNLISFIIKLNNSFRVIYLEDLSLDDRVNNMKHEISIIDSEKGKQGNYFYKLENERVYMFSDYVFRLPYDELREGKSRFFPDDVLSFHIKCVLTCEHSACRQYSATLEGAIGWNEKPLSTDMLINDLKWLYNDDTLKDMELRTKTKTFKAHKAILSARSNKFRNLFSSNRQESTSGHEDMSDFEEDTVEEMLLYIYTGSLEDLSYERACKLHAISNYYEILSLKSTCSSFLEDSLCQANACEILVLANLQNDGGLKTAVEDYILRYDKPIVFSQKWNDLMKHHRKIAANVMRRMIKKNNL